MDSSKESTDTPAKETKKDVVDMFKSKKGRVLPASTRAVVFNVVQFALKEKAAKTPIMDLRKAMERVAAMTGLSRDTVFKIKKEGAKNGGLWETPKRRPRPKVKTILNDADKMVLLNKLDEFERRNEAISLRKLLIILKEEINFAGGKDSLRRVLLAMGYKWEKNQANKKMLRKPEETKCSSETDKSKVMEESLKPSMPLYGMNYSLDQSKMHRLQPPCIAPMPHQPQQIPFSQDSSEHAGLPLIQKPLLHHIYTL